MSKELFKEAIKVLKAVKSTDIEISEVQVYLTTDDGEIMELCIGYDEDGEIQGGPMYVISEGMSPAFKPLAYFFSIAGIFGCLALLSCLSDFEVIQKDV